MSIQTVRVAAMILSGAPLQSWGDHFALHLKNETETPSSVRLLSAEDITDRYTQQILINLQRKNEDSTLTVPTQNVVIELAFDSAKPIRYRRHRWLDQGITSYTARPDLVPIGLYGFYLVRKKGMLAWHAVGRCDTGHSIHTDFEEDDMSYLDSQAEFVDDLYYNDGPNEEFAANAAKLALQFTV